MKTIPTRVLLICALFSLAIESAHADTAQPGSNFSAGNGMEMIWVAPLNGWAGKYLVTQDEYQKVMGTNPSYYKGPRHPVGMVSWNDALDYCKKLTDLDHASGVLPADDQYNLPTDAQFDLLAGNNGGVNDAAQLLNQQKPNFTADVGSKGANEYGLFDMRGLFWQWCLDDFNRKTMDTGPETADAQKKYYFMKGGTGKVLRGGTLPHFYTLIPASFRYWASPDLHFNIYGFRAVVATAPSNGK